MRTPHRMADAPIADDYIYDERAADEHAAFDDWFDGGAEDSVPPDHRRAGRRRRRSRLAGLSFALKGLIAILVLCGFLALADRWAVLYAENKAAQQIKKQMKLTAAPEVEISGFPFLTQLADRRIHELKVTVPDVAADRVTLAKVSATAHNVRIKGSGPTDISGAYADTIHGEVLLSFADLNRELGSSQVTFSGHGKNKVLARGTLPVAGHDVKVRADANIQRLGASGISTDIDNMSLAIGDLATYRPGTRSSEGLHLTRSSVDKLTKQVDKARQLLAVPAVVKRLGVPDSAVQQALNSDAKLRELTGTPRFVKQLMGTNLIDIALAHPALLKKFGLDPALLDGLTRLTRPELADRLSLAFRLPKLPGDDGYVRLQDVTVEKEGIRVDLSGGGLSVGK
ncbi:LmeA family phospholipid-binding protein [Streptomyces sp. NBC_00483]|uniref:LmeA family phospholipid-binding protein n=1 Tax=Streptomyces sp. NBC_00483 TaxID=2975756 RepID=UPI002E19DB79